RIRDAVSGYQLRCDCRSKCEAGRLQYPSALEHGRTCLSCRRDNNRTCIEFKISLKWLFALVFHQKTCLILMLALTCSRSKLMVSAESGRGFFGNFHSKTLADTGG